MELDKETEDKLKAKVIKLMEIAIPDWGVPHILTSVYWMRKLIDGEGGDERVLLTTMYLHDIGYKDLQKGYGFDDMMKAKPSHAENSVTRAKKILEELNYSQEEINEILHLIGEHYNKENINSHNMQLVVEADGLAKIDWERCKPNFNKEDTKKYFEYYKGRIVPKFKTETGEKFLKELLAKAERYWD